MALIAPSLIAADLARLAEGLETIKAAGASMVHVDVTDGHFVPDITVGQPVIASLRKATGLVLDVHLLIERPERYVTDFVEAGADRVSVHIEATAHLHKALDLIRAGGARAGVALNPATPIESLAEVWRDIDFLNVLTADPGLEGAAYLPGSVAKVRAARQTREGQRWRFALQVEGAIAAANLEELVQAGADILVIGSAIFRSMDPQAELSALMRRAAGTGLTAKV